MPKEGDEFDTYTTDPCSSANEARRITYRYRKNGRTVDPVRIVVRKIRSKELRFSDDPWQPVHWVIHYGDETIWNSSIGSADKGRE
jgi:hypothetical protein